MPETVSCNGQSEYGSDFHVGIINITAANGGNSFPQLLFQNKTYLGITRTVSKQNKYVSPYCRAEMYTGRVACCPLVSHGEYADGTDGRMPDCYIMLSTGPLDVTMKATQNHKTTF